MHCYLIYSENDKKQKKYSNKSKKNNSVFLYCENTEKEVKIQPQKNAELPINAIFF